MSKRRGGDASGEGTVVSALGSDGGNCDHHHHHKDHPGAMDAEVDAARSRSNEERKGLGDSDATEVVWRTAELEALDRKTLSSANSDGRASASSGSVSLRSTRRGDSPLMIPTERIPSALQTAEDSLDTAISTVDLADMYMSNMILEALLMEGNIPSEIRFMLKSVHTIATREFKSLSLAGGAMTVSDELIAHNSDLAEAAALADASSKGAVNSARTAFMGGIDGEGAGFPFGMRSIEEEVSPLQIIDDVTSIAIYADMLKDSVLYVQEFWRDEAEIAKAVMLARREGAVVPKLKEWRKTRQLKDTKLTMELLKGADALVRLVGLWERLGDEICATILPRMESLAEDASYLGLQLLQSFV